MKAYLVARVSTEDQKDALPAQVHRLLDYAVRQNYTYELIEIQESAYKGNRDIFRGVIGKISAETEVVAVVFDKVDRYSRDYSAEETRILEKMRKAGAIELHFPSDNLVVHKNSPATDRMRLGLNTVLAQYYSDSISDNVKRRLEQKLRDGEWIGAAPFGYKNVTLPNGNKSVKIDDFNAQVVRAIFEWYAGGVTSFRTIRHKLQASYGIIFSASNVEYVLKNPFYAGNMRCKGKLYPHKYERIISQELFERVTAVREGYHVQPKRWAGLPYTYRGLINCSECGCMVTFEKKKAKYVYGHCTQTKGKHGADYVPEKKLTEQFERVFKNICVPEHVYHEVSSVLKAEDGQDNAQRTQKLAHIDSEIKRYEARSERVYEDYIDEKIPETLYDKKSKQYEQTIKALRKTRKKFELIAEDRFNTISYLLNISRNAPKLFEKAKIDQKRSLIKMVHSNLELAGKELRSILKEPYNTMALCNVSGNWLWLLYSNWCSFACCSRHNYSLITRITTIMG